MAVSFTAARDWVKGNVIKTLAILSAAGYFGYNNIPKMGPNTPSQTVAAAASGDVAVKTTSFEVKSAGKTAKGGLLFLNSTAAYDQAENIPVVVQTWKVTNFKGIDPKSYIGKTITVRVPVTQYKGKPQFLIEDGSKIEIK